MDPQLAIEVDGLKVAFRVNGYTPRAELLGRLVRAAAGMRPRPEDPSRQFFAVDGLSFGVRRGECFGIVGDNGCGKSTTLKVIAGLLRPDAGRVRVRGRIQALIALGAGFTGQLTGLENVYNNAAVLGLSASATRRIIDGVIDFSELGAFIDAPVRTYSSGMRARLGFAVAVHLEPELLILDEILSVGDHRFREKCAGHIDRLREAGTTILLVSHSHAQVGRLCSRVLWMRAGRAVMLGEAAEVVSAYRRGELPPPAREPAAGSA